MATSNVALTIADDIDLHLELVADGSLSAADFVDRMADLVTIIRVLDGKFER